MVYIWMEICLLIAEVFGGLCRFLPSHSKMCSCDPRNLWGYWTIVSTGGHLGYLKNPIGMNGQILGSPSFYFPGPIFPNFGMNILWVDPFQKSQGTG